MLKLGRCWPWKTLSVHLKYNRNATSKGPQVNNKTIWITNTCRYEKGKITKGSSALRGYFSILILTTGMTKVSTNATGYSYTCINSDMNLSFLNWSTKKMMMVYLYKHCYFFFKYPIQYYVRSKNGIFQPVCTKCGLGKKQRMQIAD